ncbi:MAG: antibiotic biosynthesis monooxygenase family protein [Euzebya sp.]
MVLEVALIDVKPGSEADFTAAYAQARSIVAGSQGIGAIRMTQGIETPTRFVLLIQWDSVEAHEAFRSGEGFTQWRSLIGPHFSGPPHVEHFRDID